MQEERGKSGVIYGYARVSTDKQDKGSDTQCQALLAAGCMEIIEEQASGRRQRPALTELVERLRAGDVLTVTRFDRISRNVPDFYAIGQRISQRGASLRSLAEQFDTATPIGKAMMGFAAVWAELESETIGARVSAGMRATKARGDRIGRKRALSPEAEQAVAAAIKAGARLQALARKHGVNVSTIRRIGLRHSVPT